MPLLLELVRQPCVLLNHAWTYVGFPGGVLAHVVVKAYLAEDVRAGFPSGEEANTHCRKTLFWVRSRTSFSVENAFGELAAASSLPCESLLPVLSSLGSHGPPNSAASASSKCTRACSSSTGSWPVHPLLYAELLSPSRILPFHAFQRRPDIFTDVAVCIEHFARERELGWFISVAVVLLLHTILGLAAV